MVRFSVAKLVLFCFILCLIFTTYLVLKCSNENEEIERYKNSLEKLIHQQELFNSRKSDNHRSDQNVDNNPNDVDWQSQKLAVLVPYRNRFEEMLEFVPWIHQFLNNQKIPHQIVVVNQVDSHRFNRAALINIGYLKTKDECDYLVMHDVDLLPNNPKLLYTYPQKGPNHLASPEYHPIYHYKTYVGGVLMMTNEHFAMCRGMSNSFWGWGREDDELYLRFKENKLTLYRPTGLTTGYNTFKHVHDKQKRPRDYKRYGDQKKNQFKRDRLTGFDTLQYKLESMRSMVIDGAPVNIYNVELHCDKTVTPWCDHEKT